MLGCMEPLFQKRKGYQRIYLDLPGMGRSPASDRISSTDDMLDVVISFIKNSIPNQNFLLAGESYGGYLARGIVLKLGRFINGLLLICPVVVADSKQRNRPSDSVVCRDDVFLTTLSPDEAKQYCSMGAVQTERIFRRFQNEIMSGLEMVNPDFIKKLRKKYSFSSDIDKTASEKYNKPVLLLAGRQDSCVGYHDLWKIIENYPRATFAVLDMAGHNLQIEQPGLFNCLVSDWITRTERNNPSQL